MKIKTPEKWLDRAKMTGIQLLPKNTLSRAFGAISDISLPTPLQGIVNQGFALYAGIDLSESEATPHHYRSLNAFFTRRLKDGVHNITPESNAICSTADGKLSEFGKIEDGTLLQAKGRSFSLVDFLDSARDAKKFEGGSFITVYLSPRDYHRVHSPIAGKVQDVSYIPGHLFPVNPLAVEHIDQLFAVNERLITFLDTEIGDVAVVMVGATCVGRMSLSFADLKTNQAYRKRFVSDEWKDTELQSSEELGMFNLGSTVVLLIANPEFEFLDTLETGQETRIGTIFGRS